MFKDLTTQQLQALASKSLQWNLTRLYELWDALQFAWKNVNNELMQDFMHFPEGTPLQDIHDWFQRVNPRFCVEDVLVGTRLTPLTSRLDAIPVYDKNGIQVCLGDALKAQICIGRYGQVTQIDAVADKAHLQYGSLISSRNGKVETLFFNGFMIAGYDIGLNAFVDFEHGHETWIEIVSTK